MEQTTRSLCVALSVLLALSPLGCADPGLSESSEGEENWGGKADGTGSTRLLQLVRSDRGLRIAGTARLHPLGGAGELEVEPGTPMPIVEYQSQVVPVWEAPYAKIPSASPEVTLQDQRQPAVGEAYFLPWKKNSATMMRLPVDAGAARTFLTAKMDGCAILVGETPDGDVLVMHMNTPDTEELLETEQKLADAFTARDEAGMLAATRARLDALDDAYEAARRSAVDQGLFEPGRVSLLTPKTYMLAHGQPKTAAYVTGTLDEDGWTLRWSWAGAEADGVHAIDIPYGTPDEAFELAPEPVELPPDEGEGSLSDIESDVSSAYESAVESLSDLDRFPVGEQAIRIGGALRLDDAVRRIFAQRPLPASVASRRASLTDRLSELGVEYGPEVTEDLGRAFRSVDADGSPIAGFFAEGGKAQLGFRYLGRAFFVVGLAVSGYKIATADDKKLEAAYQLGGWAGAVVAGSAAGLGMSYITISGAYAWILTGAVELVAGVAGFWGAQRLLEEVYALSHHADRDRVTTALHDLESVPALPPTCEHQPEQRIFGDADETEFFVKLTQRTDLTGEPSSRVLERKDVNLLDGRNEPFTALRFEPTPVDIWVGEIAADGSPEFRLSPEVAGDAPLGKAYVLPAHAKDVTSMVLPDGPKAAKDFIARVPYTSGLHLAENASGDLVVMITPTVETLEVKETKERYSTALASADADAIRDARQPFLETLDGVFWKVVEAAKAAEIWQDNGAKRRTGVGPKIRWLPQADDPGTYMVLKGTLGKDGWFFALTAPEDGFNMHPIGWGLGVPDAPKELCIDG